MRRKLIRTVVVAATLTFVACAGEESEAVSDTSATSAGLLSGMPRSAVTPMGNDNLPPTPTQEWDFLALGFLAADFLAVFFLVVLRQRVVCLGGRNRPQEHHLKEH